MKKILILLMSIFFFSILSHAESQSVIYNNDKALKGLTEAKAYFDVTIG